MELMSSTFFQWAPVQMSTHEISDFLIVIFVEDSEFVVALFFVREMEIVGSCIYKAPVDDNYLHLLMFSQTVGPNECEFRVCEGECSFMMFCASTFSLSTCQERKTTVGSGHAEGF